MKSKIDIIFFITLFFSAIVNFLLLVMNADQSIRFFIYSIELNLFIVFSLCYSQINKKLISDHDKFKSEILKQDLKHLELVKRTNETFVKWFQKIPYEKNVNLTIQQHTQYSNDRNIK